MNTMGPETILSPDLALAWRQAPLEMMEGGEVFKNLKTPGGRSLQGVWKRLRGHLLEKGIVIIGLQGRSKHGKGGGAMGFFGLSRDDEYLREALWEVEVDFDVKTFPFAHFSEVAKILGVVDPKLNPATYSFGDERKIARLQWRMIEDSLPRGVRTAEELTLALKEQKRALLFIVEASTPLAYPVRESVVERMGGFFKRLAVEHRMDFPAPYSVPVKVKGTHDLGQSTLYNLALDPRTRPHSWVFTIQKNAHLIGDKDSDNFRSQVFRVSSDNPDLDELSHGSTKLIVSTPNGGSVSAELLPPQMQRNLSILLKKSMATPEAVLKFNRQLDELEEDLYREGQICAPTDAAYIAFVRKILSLSEDRCMVLKNPFMPDEDKSYDASYLLESEPVRRFPQLAEPRSAEE